MGNNTELIHGWRSKYTQYTLNCFVMTGVLKPSAGTEMVLAICCIFLSSKVKNVISECTRTHLFI